MYNIAVSARENVAESNCPIRSLNLITCLYSFSAPVVRPQQRQTPLSGNNNDGELVVAGGPKIEF